MAQATNLSRPKGEVKLVVLLRTYVIIALITTHWANLGVHQTFRYNHILLSCLLFFCSV